MGVCILTLGRNLSLFLSLGTMGLERRFVPLSWTVSVSLSLSQNAILFPNHDWGGGGGRSGTGIDQTEPIAVPPTSPTSPTSRGANLKTDPKTVHIGPQVTDFMSNTNYIDFECPHLIYTITHGPAFSWVLGGYLGLKVICWILGSSIHILQGVPRVSKLNRKKCPHHHCGSSLAYHTHSCWF